MDNFIFRKTNNNHVNNNNINSSNSSANVATVFTTGISKKTSRLFSTASTGIERDTNTNKEGQVCYAFRRGNITFTSHPPANRGIREKMISGQPVCSKLENIKTKTNKLQAAEDFCEICCGMRSPNSARRAQAFTTHFCTKIPAKFSTSAKQRSHDTFLTTSGCTSACSSSSVSSDSEVNDESTATISASAGCGSALSKLSSAVYSRNSKVSDDSVLNYHPENERIKRNRSRNNLSDSGNDLDKAFSIHDSLYPLSSAANSGSKKRQQSLRSSLSYLSLDDSYTSAFTMSSRNSCLCCDASTATDISSNYNDSFDKITGVSRQRQYHRHIVSQQQPFENTTVSISSYYTSSDSAKRSLSVRSSVAKCDDDDDEDDNETCSSEMGWSFNSLCEDNPFAVDRRKKNIDREHSITDNINNNDNDDDKMNKTSTLNESRYMVSPFTLNENRKRNVAVKFGVVVANLKKPGHHVGPIRNPDCFCDNCVYFYKNASPYI